MSTISTVEFNLATYSIYNTATQAFEDATVTGNVYTVAGVTDSTGELRKLSMGELVMVVGLARAAEKEKSVINLMREMERTTATLEGLTEIEKKLLDGTSLDSITGMFYYGGYKFPRAKDFLAYVLGYDSLPDISQYHQRQIDNLTAIREKLASGINLVTMTGTWEDFDGNRWNAIYYLEIIEVLDNDEFGFYNGLRNMANRPGDTVSEDVLQNFRDNYGLDLPPGATKTELFEEVHRVFGPDLIRRIDAKIVFFQENGVGTPFGPSAGDVSLPTGNDLISEIESKMDSMNSFSQQKMIELQSETNKRDQAYDRITNILKSMNTVQVGIVNNI